MKILMGFLAVVTLTTSVLSNVMPTPQLGIGMTAIPVGIGETKELQDANASLAGNWFRNPDSVYGSLHMDGRNDFIVRVRGGHAEIEVEVNAPRAIDKKTGKPKYKLVFQLGNGEIKYGEHLGGNKWLIVIDFNEVKIGLQHLRIGLDGLVVGRGRPHFDVLFFRVPLPGKDVKEDRGIIGKLVFLEYEGANDPVSITQFLVRRAQEYPLTQRVAWVNELDGNPVGSIFDQHRPQPISDPTPPQKNLPRNDPPREREPDPEVEDFLAYSDGDAKTFVVQNNFRDRNLEVTLEGTKEAGAEEQKPVIVKPGKKSNFRLSAIPNRTKLTFIIRDTKTGKVLDRQRYTEGS